MNRRRALVLSVSGLVFTVGVTIAILLWYYRPTVEYAYVDIVDLRKDPSAFFPFVAVAAALALVGLGFGVWLKRRRGRQNG